MNRKGLANKNSQFVLLCRRMTPRGGVGVERFKLIKSWHFGDTAHGFHKTEMILYAPPAKQLDWPKMNPRHVDELHDPQLPRMCWLPCQRLVIVTVRPPFFAFFCCNWCAKASVPSVHTLSCYYVYFSDADGAQWHLTLIVIIPSYPYSQQRMASSGFISV